jgi:hypothetical protein
VPNRLLSACALVAVASLTLGAARAVPWVGSAAPADFAAESIKDSTKRLATTEAPLCPQGMLPDGKADVCVHMPDDDLDEADEAREHEVGPESADAPTDDHRSAQGPAFDPIPRRPDRSASYDDYRYPVVCERCVVGSDDRDRPRGLASRNRNRSSTRSSVLDLAAPKGTPVRVIALDHQQGPAEVLFVGDLFGTTVVTLHAVHEAGVSKNYIVMLGQLDGAAPSVAPGVKLQSGDLLGFVGDSGSPSRAHLRLEIRRVRAGVDPLRLALKPSEFVAQASTVACDPRNVLPRRSREDFANANSPEKDAENFSK